MEKTKKYNFNNNIGELEIDPQYIDAGISYAQTKKLTKIAIYPLNQNSGNKYDIDLSPLERYMEIESLSISDSFKVGKVAHAESLYKLQKLQHMTLWQYINLDFAQLPQLDSLYLKYDKRYTDIGSLVSLTDLLYSHVKEQDCSTISKLVNLKILRITGDFKNLNGLENLHQIEILDVTYCRKLENISALLQLTNLQKLHIEKCKLITDFSSLSSCQNLEYLFIDTLDSINFIKSLLKLQKINF